MDAMTGIGRRLTHMSGYVVGCRTGARPVPSGPFMIAGVFQPPEVQRKNKGASRRDGSIATALERAMACGSSTLHSA